MEYLSVFLPSLGVGLIFYLVMRWLFRGDRAERSAQANVEQDAERWYEDLKEREGDQLPFGYQEVSSKKKRGLELKNSIPIRDTPQDK